MHDEVLMSRRARLLCLLASYERLPVSTVGYQLLIFSPARCARSPFSPRIHGGPISPRVHTHSLPFVHYSYFLPFPLVIYFFYPNDLSHVTSSQGGGGAYFPPETNEIQAHTVVCIDDLCGVTVTPCDILYVILFQPLRQCGNSCDIS